MIQDSYNILTELLSSFRQEFSDINTRIHENTLLIKEEEACVKAIEENDSDELKIFYPRSGNTLFQKEEIEKSNIRKADYEEQNRKLNEIKTNLEYKIHQLEKVLKYESRNITMMNFQEEDRRRIARDLHDTSLQNIVHLIHKIELCDLYIDQDPLKAKLELSLLSKTLKDVMNDIRNTIFDIRPMSFDDLGLKASLERLLEKINEDRKYEIVSEIDDVSCENNLVLVYIYRTVQESLNNIVKHAEAQRIFFQCKEHDGFCVIHIEDDGRGFCEKLEVVKEEKHFGLSLMRERVEFLNGKIDISSSEGSGTRIHIEIPLVQ